MRLIIYTALKFLLYQIFLTALSSNAANCFKKDLEGKYTLFTAHYLDLSDEKENREKKIVPRNPGDAELGHFPRDLLSRHA